MRAQHTQCFRNEHPSRGASVKETRLIEGCSQQGSWSQMRTDQVVSITSKEEKSSACSLVPTCTGVNYYSHHMMPEAAECSMCGDVGLPQYLFKCLACSHRYQHIYCCQFYPYRMEARTCNWCLVPILDHQENNIEAATRAIYSSADIVDRRKQKLEQHTRAFEYLLQVAELHEQGHKFDDHGCPIEADSCFVPGLSEKSDVGADHTRERTSTFHKLDHGIGSPENAASTREPLSLEVHKMIFGDCHGEHTRGPYPRKGGRNVGYYVRDLSATTMQSEHNHGLLHAYVGHDQRPSNVVNQGIDKSRIIKESSQTPAGHDQIPCIKLFYQDSSGHNLTTRKLNGLNLSASELDQPAKVNQSFKRPDDCGVSKRARLHKQSQASLTAGRDQGITAAGEQTTTSQALVSSLVLCRDTNSEDQPLVGDKCRTGPAYKRPRHRSQSGAQTVGDESLNLAAGRRMAAGNIELDNTAVPIDQQGATSMKLQISSPTHLAWSSTARAAGKRDHLLSSPSRAINRRYKLLADVLC